MTKKINFTDEHLAKLRSLIADAVLSNLYVNGFMGSNFNVYDLIHTLSITSLRNISASLTKKRASLAVEDAWVENPNLDKITEIDTQIEMISLIIGYKLHLNELAQNEIERSRIQKQIDELTEASKSPAELINDLKERLKELE